MLNNRAPGCEILWITRLYCPCVQKGTAAKRKLKLPTSRPDRARTLDRLTIDAQKEAHAQTDKMKAAATNPNRALPLPSGREMPILGQGTWRMAENPAKRKVKI